MIMNILELGEVWGAISWLFTMKEDDICRLSFCISTQDRTRRELPELLKNDF